MASPLNYFRKHQGYILAVLGVILIVTWVIGPSVLNLFDRSPGESHAAGDASIVAKWKKGNLTRSDFNRMAWEHQAAIRYLGMVVERALEAGGKPQAPFLRMEQNQIDLGLPMGSSDETLVHILFLAEKAKELGVHVDQQAVDDYLNNLGGYVLSQTDLHELAQESLSQYRDQSTKSQLVTVSQLFDRLKVELAARQAQEMCLSGLGGFSTGELWEYHGRLHRRYKIEAYPIDVAEYKARIKGSDAKEEELRKIYDAGKDRPPHPETYEPGFSQPRRIAFGYVKVDFEKFLDDAKKQIPEERISEEYQKEIAAGNFRKLKLPGTDPTKPPENKTTAPPQDGEKGAKPKEPAGDKEPPKADSSDAKVKEDGSKASPSNDDKKGEPAKSSTESRESPAKEGKDCQEEPAKTADDDAKAKSADQNSAPDKPVKGAPAADQISDKSADPSQAKTEQPEFRPLSEVREELLTKLALPEARAASDTAVKAVIREVQDYSVKYIRWTESKKAGGKANVKDPGELKIKSLASKYNMIVGETPLRDQFQIADTELGPHVGGAFFENRPLYAPQQAASFRDEGTFVYWRTQEQPAAEVPYEKARPQVVDAWIKERAAEAARKEAEALAAKAAKADSLKSALTADEAKKVLTPLPFSWLSVGGAPLAFGGAARPSDVIGIPQAGEEFMKAVFALDVGQTGVAINNPHTTVYVVRIVAEEPALDIRREMFLSSLQAGIFGDLARYAIMERQQLASEVIVGLQKEYQLVWVESPRFDAGM